MTISWADLTVLILIAVTAYLLVCLIRWRR